ncbi:MAG TPA: ATP-binding protein, partial [Thermoanaerobaculia bacterium]|nr:ATP-binding protein [Thermoanaerobaculia bacterium]
SPLDQRYDQVFRGLLDDVAELEAAIAERMIAGRRRARRLFAAILAAWTGLVVGAVVTVRRRERRHRRAEAQLAEREAQLSEAQKLEAVGRLAGGLAHDVNNYMAAIQAQCGVIRLKRGGDLELAGMLDEVGDTVGRVAGLLERLLAFSRSRPLAPRVVDLNEMAREMGGMMRRLLGDDVELEMRLAGGLWATEVDPAEIEQVLVNLLVNAREAMPSGGRVTLATANRQALDGGEEWVVLSVTDEGEGIPEEARERIFEPFFSTKRGSGHSGLGLATVYSVARRAGGFVTFDSVPGAGTRFDVHFPRVRRPAEPRPARRRETLPAAAVAPASVLLVEDNTALAVASAAFLGELGHRVVREADGRRALARLDRADAFDLVITDLVLPGASGQEVAARALALGLPVVVVSAFPDRVDLHDLVDRPEVRFLAKPYSPEDLIAALSEVLVARPDRRRAPTAAL